MPLILTDVADVPRKNPELNEPIKLLDNRLILAKGDAKRAFREMTTDEQMFVAKQLMMCGRGPGITGLLYFLCNFFFIKTKGAGFKPIYPLWDSQILLLTKINDRWMNKLPVWFMILKARQLGISTVVEGIILWLTIFNKNWTSLLLADEPDQTEYLFEMFRNGYEALPWWMQPERRYDVKGHHVVFDRTDAEERVKSPGLKSQLLAESANQRSGAGYGKTILALHASEVPKYKNPRVLTEGIIPTVPENNPAVFVILEGAAQKRHDFYHKLWGAADLGTTIFEPLFIEWFRERQYFKSPPSGWTPIKDTLALAKQVEDETKVSLNAGQLYWYERKRETYLSLEDDDGTFLSQYPSNPTEAFQNAGLCAFSKRKLRYQLINYCRKAKWRGEIRLDDNDKFPRLSYVEDGRLQIWETPHNALRDDANAVFYVAGDPSLGVPGGDPSCWQVFIIPSSPFEPLRQVAVWHGWVGPSQFARIGAALGYMYGIAEVCPEKNGIGETVISDLKNVINYPNLYRWRRMDKAKGFWTDFFGWATSMSSKQNLIAKMREGLDEDLIVIRDAKTIDEAYDFIDEGGNSFYSVSKDGHGDRWFAAMIGFYCSNQLRPFKERSEARQQFVEQRRDPRRDFINTDYSAVHDKNPQFDNVDVMLL